MRLYAANIDTGNIWEKYIDISRTDLSCCANRLCDDGTIAVVEMEGSKKNILFVNPKSMTSEKIAVPVEDVWDIVVSPDKKKVAFTKYDGTYVSDIGFSKIESLFCQRKCRTPRMKKPPNCRKPLLSRATARMLFYYRAGYETSCGYGLYNVVTRADRYFELPDMEVSLFSEGRLLAADAESLIPDGYIDIDGTSNEIQKIDEFPQNPAVAIETNQGSDRIGLLYVKNDKTTAKIYNSMGELIGETGIDNGLGSEIRIIDNKDVAVITTQEDTGRHAEIYIWNY